MKGEQRYNWELQRGDVIRLQPSGRLVVILNDPKLRQDEHVRVHVKTLTMPLGEWWEDLPADRRHKVFRHLESSS